MDGFYWSRFFDELERVIDSCYTQIGRANESYVTYMYIVEKLESGLRNINVIHEMLSVANQPEDELQAEVSWMIWPLNCIRLLLCYWDVYLSELESS